MSLFRKFFRRRDEITQKKQREYALQLIQQMLAVKTEQCETLREEIRIFKRIAPLLEDDQIS